MHIGHTWWSVEEISWQILEIPVKSFFKYMSDLSDILPLKFQLICRSISIGVDIGSKQIPAQIMYIFPFT